MAKFSEENGGLFRYEDFASYTAKVETPVSVDYRGYRVYKNPSANQGPTELFALNILEGYDLKKLGHNSPDYIHTSAEAIKLALADRDKYLGDTDFIKMPWEGLLSKDYAAERRRLIDPKKASLELRPGVAEKFAPGMETLERPLDYQLAGKGDHEGDTSYIAVVDKDRNAISLTPSLHTAFGTKVVMGDLGFSFNCRGDYYSLMPGQANALAPGKRPRSTLQSTMVLKDGKPVMVTGSPGGDDQCMRTMQTFLNVVEFGMNIQQAIEAPRWTTRAFPSSPFPHVMYPLDLGVEDRVPAAVRTGFAAGGISCESPRRGPWVQTAQSCWTPRPAFCTPAPIREWTPTRWPGSSYRVSRSPRCWRWSGRRSVLRPCRRRNAESGTRPPDPSSCRSTRTCRTLRRARSCAAK